MKTEFNHAANNSPRSGSTKKVSPVVWAVIVAVAVAATVWFTMHVDASACVADVRMHESGLRREAAFLSAVQ